MNNVWGCDEQLIQRLPLPLARLYRRAGNAATPLERHHNAFYLWEAGLKILASASVVSYAGLPAHDPEVNERLKNLARPSLGHWWEFARLLVPILAEAGDDDFAALRDFIWGKTRHDLLRLAGLDAVLRETLEVGAGARSTVNVRDAFERLLEYRNRSFGHGAVRPVEFYRRMGEALRAGIPELLTRLDVLAGRRLLHVGQVQRVASGEWEVEMFELIGENPRRLDPLHMPPSEAGSLPNPAQIYLALKSSGTAPWRLTSLHPLLIYDAEEGDVLFLNSRRGKKRSEYLNYCSGALKSCEHLISEQRELLRRVLDMPIDEALINQYAAATQINEGPTTEEVSWQRTIGEFELISVLGKGGMGIVYRARQPSLERDVALKCLMGSGDESEARFAGEIRALGHVSHPGLVRIFSSGSDGHQWFYAMELLEGATLAAICEALQETSKTAADVKPETWRATLSTACDRTRSSEKRLAAEFPDSIAKCPAKPEELPELLKGTYVGQVVELVRQVAEAAHALHGLCIFHRDIKPGNIIVTPDGTRAILMDLGLAQFADELDRKLTRTRQFVGTLRYASPEQVLAVDRLDCRSDVYSLGATLWELLTLRPLFNATEMTPTASLMTRIPVEDPEPVRKYNREVPADLEAIVLKCLEKEAHRRYSTAEDLAHDLDRWLKGEPVQARRRTRAYVLQKWARRRRYRIVALLLFVSLQVGLVLAMLQRSLWQQVATAVEMVQNNHGPNVPDRLRELQKLPHDMVLRELKTRYAAADAHRKLGLAYALAEYGELDAPFLGSQIVGSASEEGAGLEEVDNLVMALGRSREPSLKALSELAKVVQEDQAWRLKARLAVVALHLDDARLATDMCRIDDRPDPVQRTIFIDELPAWHGDVANLAAKCRDLSDPGLRSAVCMSIGSIPQGRLAADDQEVWKPLLAEWFQSAPENATHSAAGWALRQWGTELPALAVTSRPGDGRQRFVNSLGMTMLKIPAGQFDRDDAENAPQHPGKQTVNITRAFFLGDREVSVNQFQKFLDDAGCPKEDRPGDLQQSKDVGGPAGDHPRWGLSWYDAVLFCNWLSRNEGLALCYERTGTKEKIDNVEYDEWRLAADGTGYRLPTEAEWEYACRAGTTTDFACGNDVELLRKYAVFQVGTTRGSAACGSKLPNSWGLFDLHGNLWEWCYDRRDPYGAGDVSDPTGPSKNVSDEDSFRRVVRGGCWNSDASNCQSANRHGHRPTASEGFRVVRSSVQ